MRGLGLRGSWEGRGGGGQKRIELEADMVREEQSSLDTFVQGTCPLNITVFNY